MNRKSFSQFIMLVSVISFLCINLVSIHAEYNTEISFPDDYKGVLQMELDINEIQINRQKESIICSDGNYFIEIFINNNLVSFDKNFFTAINTRSFRKIWVTVDFNNLTASIYNNVAFMEPLITEKIRKHSVPESLQKGIYSDITSGIVIIDRTEIVVATIQNEDQIISIVENPSSESDTDSENVDFSNDADNSLTIVTFGDSITAFRTGVEVFSQQLERKYSAKGVKLNIINSGVPGNNTNQALQRLERDVLSYNPDIVTILFGINDSMYRKTDFGYSARVPIHRYSNNIKKIIASIQNAGAVPVLISPNPLAWTEQLKDLYGNKPYKTSTDADLNIYLDQYIGVLSGIALKQQIAFIDFNTILKHQEESYQYYLFDGMHMNTEGHEILTGELEKIIDLSNY